MNYIPLRVKTSYSILSSLNRIDKLTEKASELGYFSLAITDTNNMFGGYEFYPTGAWDVSKIFVKAQQ